MMLRISVHLDPRLFTLYAEKAKQMKKKMKAGVFNYLAN